MLWLRRLVEWIGRTITPRRTDTVLGAFLTVAVLIEVVATTATFDRSPWVPGLVVAPIATVAVCWRRRAPIPAAITCGAAFFVASSSALLLRGQHDGNQIPVFAGIASLVLLYAAIRYGEGWLRVAIWVGSLVGSALDEAARSHGLPYTSIVSSWVFSSALVALAQAFRYRADLRAERAEQARVGEREQLARELHDVVAHHVSAMVVQATAALAVIEKQPEAAVPALRFIKASGQETIGEMRRMVGILRGSEPVELAPRRGIAGLEDLAVELPGAAPVRLHRHGTERVVDVSVGQSVHRIVQEAITNARRHARGAGAIDVTLLWELDHVEVEVVDDGAHVATTGAEGFGLVGMAERARLLDGTFAAGPRPGGGWRVHCRLPLPPDPALDVAARADITGDRTAPSGPTPADPSRSVEVPVHPIASRP